MLDTKRIEAIIYKFVGDHYGSQEAYSPSYNLTKLAEEVANKYESNWQPNFEVVYDWEDDEEDNDED